MVGNGATNWDHDVSPSFPATVYGFNLIPKKHFDFMEENNCVYYFNDFRPHSGPKECDKVWEEIQNLTGGLNWYDLYQAPTGSLLSGADRMGSAVINGVEKHYKKGMTQAEYTPWVKNFSSNLRV